MKKKILKILTITSLILVAFITFIIGQAPLIEGKHYFDPYIDTQFAEDYSPDKFEEIKIGMSLEEVKKIIGKPLYNGEGYEDQNNTNFYYTGDGKLLNNTEDSWKNGYDDFAWYRSSIEVDNENIVISIDKGWSYD